MKDKTEVVTNGKAVFYAVLFPSFRAAAIDCGYALALHGSMARDMDLIAVPWTDDAKPVSTLIEKLSDCIGETVWKEYHFKEPTQMPHGRKSFTLSIMGDYFIDLSVVGTTEINEVTSL